MRLPAPPRIPWASLSQAFVEAERGGGGTVTGWNRFADAASGIKRGNDNATVCVRK